MDRSPRRIFVAGATGYLGRALASRLLERGHEVRGLCREGSEHKLPPDCQRVIGNALDAASYAGRVAPCDTFVHLIGVPHPSPSKAAQFRAIDLPALQASIKAAQQAQVSHFVYMSVAHPAPVMKAYIAVRQECEALIGTSGLRSTILRPWYVLGPGHRWPYALIPLYWIAEQFPAIRSGAQRLGLVSLREMLAALVQAVENSEGSPTVLGVADIRSIGRRELSRPAR